jgi:hypothetical protein
MAGARDVVHRCDGRADRSDRFSTGDLGVAEIAVMMTYPGEAGEGAAGKTPQTKSASAPLDEMTIEQLRGEMEVLRDRERQIAELLNANAPDRILHDLRNLLNEVQLLRILAEQGNA